MRRVKVFLLGRDGVGWSIDRDREYTARALAASGHRLVRNPLAADVVYCVWWNLLEAPRWRPLRYKRMVAVVTNDLAHQERAFQRIRQAVDVWVAANGAQAEFLREHGVADEAIVQSPFYVEETVFQPVEGDRAQLAERAGVDYGRVRDRFLIGSFQRDSLGEDVTRPKWQKDPELLLDVLEELRAEPVLLVLAGPRRHFVLAEARRRSIPYVYVGREPEPGSVRDDIEENTLPVDAIASLWNLLDLYVVTSKSEGGPKAVLEAALTGTRIISTPVGIAADLMPPSLLFRTAGEGAALVREQIAGRGGADYGAFARRASEVNRFDAFTTRVDRAVRLAAGQRAPAALRA